MPRCARCGCPNEQQHPDPYGLALCTHHNKQFQNGTIGTHHNPTKCEHDPTETRRMLEELTHPGESLRDTAKRIGISKDAVRGLKKHRFKAVRSKAWEAIHDAWADHTYQQTQPKQETKTK